MLKNPLAIDAGCDFRIYPVEYITPMTKGNHRVFIGSSPSHTPPCGLGQPSILLYGFSPLHEVHLESREEHFPIRHPVLDGAVLDKCAKPLMI